MSKFTDQEKIQILEDLISIKSVNNNEIEVCEYLQKLLAEHDINSDIIKINDSRANLVAEIGKDGPILGISGHMDVVCAVDESKRTYDPFKLTEVAVQQHCRRSADNKSDIAALDNSMIDIHDQNILQHGKIRLLATAGAEIVGEGPNAFQDKGYINDVE